jgi:hypothetical protein
MKSIALRYLLTMMFASNVWSVYGVGLTARESQRQLESYTDGDVRPLLLLH